MTRVKLCGLRREQDAHWANACMPDYVGFVFAAGKRQVDAKQAARLRRILAGEIKTVGVFVNAPRQEILALVEAGIISHIQLHGEETEEYIAALKQLTEAPVIKMVPVGERLPALPRNADYLLFDTLSTARGGSGRRFNWRLLQGYSGTPYFLAGGLRPDNVGEAISLLRPFAVDTSSGIETDGTKDAEKMRRFTTTVREMKP